MNINATLLGQMITFGLFIWFTMKFVWPLLIDAMAERESKIADGLAAAERGHHEKELAEERAKKLLHETKDKARDIIAQSQKRADEIVDAAKDEARSEGERLKIAARAEIDQEITQAKESLRKEVVSIALVGAEQVLLREVDAAAHEEALSKLVEQF